MLSTEKSSQDPSTTQVWDLIAKRLEAFAGAWEKTQAPRLADFLEAVPDQIRNLLLVELIKFDLDARLQNGMDRSLEEYAAEFPGFCIPTDLLYEDYHLRRRAGKPTDPQDYFRRFPERANELAQMLGVTTETHSTSIAVPRKAISVQPGDQLDDFDLLIVLGEGQYGKVFLARQRSMQRLVALKVSAARGAEAQMLAQLDHPHIVRVYDQRLLSERGFQLVYMAYLPGGTLSDVLAHVGKCPVTERSGRTFLDAIDAVLVRRGEIPPHASSTRKRWAERDWPATICALGAKLAEALDYAHRRGILHRDVKPANVLLSAEGEPQIADFNVGCCTKLDGAGPAALFGGSLAYMALEHIEAFDPGHPRAPDSLDGRADIFSLAVTLWELATGKRPFGAEPILPVWRDTLLALSAKRIAGPTAAASDLSDGSVPGLREVLVRCLHADPDRRPSTAGEMAHELQLCLRPETRKLVRPVASRWRSFLLRHPLLVAYPLAVIPNLAASLFNIAYNRFEIIAKWPDPTATDVFYRTIFVVNGLLYPLGLILFWLLFRPVANGLRRSGQANASEYPGLRQARRRCLRLGAIAALICVGSWTLAGLIWPIVLRSAAGPPASPSAYFHFLISLVVCGLIAAAYPYFFLTYVSVRVFYPMLLSPGDFDVEDRVPLVRIEREMSRYRAAATAVPLLAVALLAFRGASNQVAVALLSVAGLAGVGLAYLLEGRTRTALAALANLPGKDGASFASSSQAGLSSSVTHFENNL